MNVLQTALTIGIAAVALTLLLCGWRLLRGPTIADRVLALDTLYLSLVALLGFVGTVALARYLSRGDVVE